MIIAGSIVYTVYNFLFMLFFAQSLSFVTKTGTFQDLFWVILFAIFMIIGLILIAAGICKIEKEKYDQIALIINGSLQIILQITFFVPKIGVKSLENFIMLLFIFAMAFIVIGLIFLIVGIRNLKKINKIKPIKANETIENLSQISIQEKKENDMYCQYCGAPLDKNSLKCPGCGAYKQKN